ncbi:MAG: putative DNA-binding domain-containing protein [Hyphomicrobiales bacterium]|nr:putative DNA-binding domain-containing protein [Hyphomicrobiales bacterium]MBV9755128.1 putative DNA-binding domain-containing protein [Hyphomicrobiales bacterium]
MSTATQSRFAGALLGGDGAVPSGLSSSSKATPRRFAIYRNNVLFGLSGALAARYPAAEKIVGAEFFSAMAREFVLRRPPTSPVLLDYGEGFAEFAESFEPASELTYLPDVIRLEDLRTRAYHAADAVPLTAQDIAAVSPQMLSELVLAPHPSAAIIRSPHPVVTIWAMNSGEAELQTIENWEGEDALVVRPHQLVHVHRLPSGGATFLEAIFSGTPLGAAAEAAMARSAEFDLPANLADALNAGTFATFHITS